jgi:hypothetical protein
MPLSTQTARVAAPLRAPRLERLRVGLGDGAGTTLHVVRHDRGSTRARLARFPAPRRLVEWCGSEGVRHAIVGGFFVRPGGRPLGEVWQSGTALDHEPFASPWGGRRGSVLITAGHLELAARHELERSPAGDLLEAGPMLVRDGVSVIDGVVDPEGFSASADQFDSDITDGRYPRAALGVGHRELIAVACDGRAPGDSGLSLAELADAMVSLGARTAINLDGGGSTSLVFGGILRNAPREKHGVLIPGGRPVATAIAFEPRLG